MMTGQQTVQTVLHSAAVSASYNVLLQLFMRGLTFGLNAFILHFISKDLLGVVNVRLTLLNATIVFVSRESFRRACLSKTESQSWSQLVNLTWCIIPFGIVNTCALGLVWSYCLHQPDESVVPHYHWAVISYAVAALIELSSEPVYIVSQILLFVRMKVFVTGLALIIRGLFIAIAIVYVPSSQAILVFCAAQLLYSLVYSAGLFITFALKTLKYNSDNCIPFKSIQELLPKKLKETTFLDLEMARLTWSFSKQSFLKQLLTEGERYVMTFFNVISFSDQGIYDVINNLGSLVARFLFLPIEDAGALFFTRTLERGRSCSELKWSDVSSVAKVFECLLRIVTMIALIILVFGQSYSFLLLDIYGGSILTSSSGPLLLKWYCLYVLFLAVNGITECFLFSTMSNDNINRYNRLMLLFSALFLLSSWYFTVLFGSVGFILANCANMIARIFYSIAYAKKYFLGTPLQPLWGMLPHLKTLLALFTCHVVSSFSEDAFCCDKSVQKSMLHLLIGGSLGIILLGIIYFVETDMITFVKNFFKHKSSINKVE